MVFHTEPGSQFRESHLQLVGTAVFHSFQYIFHNQLVYDTVVAVFHFSIMVGDAQCIFLGVGFLKLGIGGNQLSNIGFVGRGRVDVELGGIGSVVALEGYFLISAAYVKGFPYTSWGIPYRLQ